MEPRITGDLQALGLNLWNLQFRVKSASGTVDKVLNRGKRFDALYDVIRYTSVSSVGDYYSDFNRTISTLTAKGYQVVEVTDFWKLTEESRAKGGYKGNQRENGLPGWRAFRVAVSHARVVAGERERPRVV